MYLGERVKNAREALGLYQRDLATINLSRNLLSNIELNKTILTPAKALILYKKIIDHSWIKDIHIELHFDELLADNEAYQYLKEADAACRELIKFDKSYISKHQLTEFDDQRYSTILRQSKHGILDYYIPYHLGEIYTEIGNFSKAKRKYFLALDNLSNIIDNDVVSQYKECIYKAAVVSSRIGHQSELLKYYMNLEYLYEASLKPVPSSLYYNIALYSQMNKLDIQAIDYLEIYLGLITDLNDRIDAYIMKAILFTNSKNPSKGIAIYQELLENDIASDDVKKKILCVNNIVYNTVKYDIQLTKNSLQFYLIELEKLTLINNNDTLKYKEYSSIAQGYYYLKDLDKSYEFFSKSLSSICNDSQYHKTIKVLEEASDLYLELGKIDEFISLITAINFDLVKQNQGSILLYVITKVQNYILLNDNNQVTLKYDFVGYVQNINFRRFL